MNEILYVSPNRLGKSMEQAKELAALASKFGSVTIHVRPVAEIDALQARILEAENLIHSIAEWTDDPKLEEQCLKFLDKER